MITKLRWLIESRTYDKDWFPWWIDDVWQWILCQVFGHGPSPDHCGIPAHDYCVWCQKSMPNQYVRDL